MVCCMTYENGLSLPPMNLGFSFDIYLTCVICRYVQLLLLCKTTC